MHSVEDNVCPALNFVKFVNPAISRKGLMNFFNFSGLKHTTITSITNTHKTQDVYNISTTTGTYIANGIAVHNCYEINKKGEVMKFETAKTFIDNLFDGKYKGYVSEEEKPFIILEFIGGEPTLQPKLMEQIVDYFVDKAIERCSFWADHFMISISSNGVHYFEPDVQHFLNKYRHRISLSITIDGNKELHDSCRVFPDGSPSYDIAVAAAMDWMKKNGNDIGSKITIAPANIEYMNDAIRHMIKLGYVEINANTVYEKGWNLDYAKIFYQKLKEIADYFIDNNLVEEIYLSLFTTILGFPKEENDLNTWCGGVGNAMLSIDPQGRLFPCIRYMESSLGNDQVPYHIGTVWDGIGNDELTAQRIKCMSCITRRTESTDECFYCPIAEGCAECSAYNYQVNGTPDSRVTYICCMHKARVMANCYYWNTWYRKNNMPDRFELHIPDEWALEIIDEEELQMLKDLAKEE